MDFTGVTGVVMTKCEIPTCHPIAEMMSYDTFERKKFKVHFIHTHCLFPRCRLQNENVNGSSDRVHGHSQQPKKWSYGRGKETCSKVSLLFFTGSNSSAPASPFLRAKGRILHFRQDVHDLPDVSNHTVEQLIIIEQKVGTVQY
jgi:hypothetical protein